MTPDPTPAPEPQAAAASDLTKRFPGPDGETLALEGISAGVAAGQITGIVGADGAGKTTLLRLLAGLLAPDAGSVTVLGHPPEAEFVRGRIGYMPQSFGLYEELTVQENLQLYADLQGLAGSDRDGRFAELMGFAGLTPFARRRAGRLSGGMKQKLGLACTLVHPPELLLLDEPTAGVDPLSRRELWTILDRLVAEGLTVVVSTAYLDEAERCGEVLLLHAGRLLARSEPRAFAEEARGRTFLLEEVPAERRHRLLTELMDRPGYADVVAQGGRLRILTEAPDGPPELPGELAGSGARIEEVAPRFEDAFIARLLAGAAETRQTFGRGKAGAGHTGRHGLFLHGVKRRFGSFYAVDDVGFEVRPGEIFGLLGPNGAGKSTLIKMICGLLPPTAGEVRVAGEDARKAPAAVRARLGYMSQQFSLYGDLTPVQNLRFFCRAFGLQGRAVERRIKETLAEFALEEVAGADSRTLPLGFKQRLALGTALLHGPDIVLLDEPTSGVDPLARRAFWQRINILAHSGVTVLVTTHFLEEAEYCDRLGVIYAGRLVALDTPDALREGNRAPDRPSPTLEDAFVALIEAQEDRSEGGAA